MIIQNLLMWADFVFLLIFRSDDYSLSYNKHFFVVIEMYLFILEKYKITEGNVLFM